MPSGSELLEPTGGWVGASQTIRIRTEWDAPDYEIFPNFTELDGGGQSWSVTADTIAGSYIVLYTTGSMSGFSEAPDVTIPITALNPSNGSSFIDQSFKVCRRHRTPPPEHLWTRIEGGESVFRTGDTLRVLISWRHVGGGELQLAADYAELVSGFVSGEESVERITLDPQSGAAADIDSFRVTYVIPGASRIGEARDAVPLSILARDALCAEVRSPEFRIDIRTGPPPSPIEHRLVAPVDRGVRDGDTVEILSRWDSGGYLLEADFTDLDGGAGGAGAVIDSSVIDTAATGSYLIRYTPGIMASRPDQPVTIPITAVDRLGDSFTDRSLTICRNLSTPGPIHLESWIQNGRRRFRNTDSLIVFSRWMHPAGLEISLEIDLTNLVPDFQPSEATVSLREDDTFLVYYLLPAPSQMVPDGERIGFRLTARDTLCSTTHYDSLSIDLDTEPPPEPPTFDPLPAQTSTSPILFSGTAPGAVRVAILLNDTVQFRVDVDDADRFSTEVDLVPGSNKIGGWAEDDIGNKTIFGSSRNTFYVGARTTTYPTPFGRDDEIVVEDGAGMREVTLLIYNLEGDVVSRFESNGSMLHVSFTWDGKDLDGRAVQPGYYLMRVRAIGLDGRVDEKLHPILFRNE